MTRDEIKQTFNMRDILAKCGLPEPNRAGFIKCPFHKGDHDASLKIYDKDFHCLLGDQRGKTRWIVFMK